MSRARGPTFKEMYGKDTEPDCKVMAISVFKTVGFTPTGDQKNVNCWQAVRYAHSARESKRNSAKLLDTLREAE